MESDCPSLEAWRSMLANDSLEALDDWIPHLDVCPNCWAIVQQLDKETSDFLEAPAGAGESSGGAVEIPQRPDEFAAVDGEAQQFLERLKVSVAPPSFAQGRFEVIRQLGEGGMAQVYECRDSKLKRMVAVKCFRPATVNPRFLIRLQREAEIHSRLVDPRIVALYDFFTERELPFLVMELVPGGTLRTLIKSHELTPLQWASFMREIVAGVAYAHEHGVVHHDLKPSNILITRQSLPPGSPDATHVPTVPYAPKITDFGLARLIDSNSDLSASQAFAGSPMYMAPERTLSQTPASSTSVDIYSIGTILYEALTGEPPFRADSLPKLFELIRHELPTPPRERDPSIPLDLETICLKCLEKKPQDRYESMRELEEELSRVLRANRIQARRRAPLVRLQRWVYRKRKLVLSLLAVTCVISFMIGSLAMFAFQQNVQRRKVEQYNEELRQKTTEALAARKEAQISHQEAIEKGEEAKRNFEVAQEKSADALQQSQRLRELLHEMLLQYDRQYKEFEYLDNEFNLPDDIRKFGIQFDEVRRNLAMRIVDEKMLDESNEVAIATYFLAGYGYNRRFQVDKSLAIWQHAIEVARRHQEKTELSFYGRAMALKCAGITGFIQFTRGMTTESLATLQSAWDDFRWCPGDAEITYPIWDESLRVGDYLTKTLMDQQRFEEAWEVQEILMTLQEAGQHFYSLPARNRGVPPVPRK
jgi:tRNA A-37 threonylcarbamoyl transferase component Bud32